MKLSQSSITDPMTKGQGKNDMRNDFIKLIKSLQKDVKQRRKQDKKQAQKIEKNIKVIKNMFDENAQLKQELKEKKAFGNKQKRELAELREEKRKEKRYHKTVKS